MKGLPLQESTKQTGVKYAQFSLVGLSNALVDLGVLKALLLLEPTRDPELLVGFNIVGLVLTNANSYLWNTVWTFRRQARHDAKQVSMFGAQALLNIGVANLLLWGLAYGLVGYTDFSAQISGNVAKVGSMLVASTLSFLLPRNFVFRKSDQESGGSLTVFLRTPDNILQVDFGERPLRNRNTIRLVEAPLTAKR